ncbi:MAG: hypothetical protein ACREUU_06965, partial [Gammaproteobacteria bacterium]
MKSLRVPIIVIGVLSFGCTPPASESSGLPEQPAEDTPVVLLTPDQKVPPFNVMARLFDPALSDFEYDSIRTLYFYTFVEPQITNKSQIPATWDEFKRRTERPRPRSAKRTGLTSAGARQLINWFAERAYFTVGSSKDDVLRVQGTPDEVTDSMWRYGTSRVFFAKGRV